jgi:hypothetical protein
MKFDGTNWVNVGNAGFSAGIAQYESLAFCPSDSLPYLAYRDIGNSYKATVMKFNGTNWVNVGTAGFSSGTADWTSLAFSPSDGEPYVAYMDWANSNKATVMKFNGNNWVNEGSSGFSAGGVGYTSLAFNLSGQPYVAYTDSVNGQKATVMYYDAPTGINELQKSRLSIYPNPATDKITIEISGVTEENNLSIVNIEGMELIRQKITDNKTEIDIGNLPSGVYFVRLTDEKTVEMGKIIKQ